MEQFAGNCIKRVNSVFMPKREPQSSCVPTMFTANYVKKYFTYKPAKIEWLEDLPATNKNARVPVSLLFLMRKSDKAKFNIPAIFQAPATPSYTKPRKYQELQYRIQTMELRMEFYLYLFELFCRTGDIVYNVFVITPKPKKTQDSPSN